jgi:4-hydroxy-tetrahydrodipicolinate reductase
LLIVGHGRMGRLVDALAPEYGFQIAGIVTSGNATRPSDWPDADVAIDFSTASAVVENARRLAERGVHLVIGTTGWQAEEEALRRELAEYPIGIVAAPNFALGVNLFIAKRDAPSGTAIAIRDTMKQAGYDAAVDVASNRVGSIPGTHTVGFDSQAETITLTHTARDRTSFARGALQAARWVRGRRGWFTMKEVIGI